MVVAPGTVRKCFSSLTRTIDTDQNGLGVDRIQTSISVPATATADKVCTALTEGRTTAYVIHIAEGIDDTAKKEFATLASRANGCLMAPQTTITHGTALGEAEFKTMAEKRMRLIWSPRSNMFLYNDTTNIELAIKSGVQVIALGQDWSMGGSVSMLEEMRFAEQMNKDKFHNVLTAKRLFEMATIDAARALAVDDLIGSLEVGKRADVTVLEGLSSSDPYEAVLAAKPKNVGLVVIDGKVIYGDPKYGHNECEKVQICGVDKFLCAAVPGGYDKLNQTFADIVSTLDNAQKEYDKTTLMGQPPISPLAPITHCD
jgi:hypothetical protein